MSCAPAPAIPPMPTNLAPVTGTRPEGTATEADASRKVRESSPSRPALRLPQSFPLFPNRSPLAQTHRPPPSPHSPAPRCNGPRSLLRHRRPLHRPRTPRPSPHLRRRFCPSDARPRRRKNRFATQLFLEWRTTHPPVPRSDALRLPFADQSFDLVTTAFGFRNLANYESGFREIHRVRNPAAPSPSSSSPSLPPPSSAESIVGIPANSSPASAA